MRSLGSSLAAGLLLAAGARAGVLHVPKEFPTIQDAVDAAVAGDEIVVGAGSYHEVVLVSGKTGLTLRGQGQAVLVEGGILMANLFIESCTDVHVEHLRFQDSLGTGISMTDSTDVTLEHCRFDNSIGGAVFIGNCGLVDLEHVVVAVAQNVGLLVQDSSQVTLRHCSVSGTSQAGVKLQDCSDVVVERVTVEDAGADGIALETVSSAVVRKCLVRNPAFSAISITGSDGLVELNRMLDVGLAAGGLFSTVVGCVIRGNRVVGGDFAYNIGGAQVQMLDNRSIEPGLEGLALGGSAPILASGNRVLKGAGFGIQVSSADGSALTDNKVGLTAIGIDVGGDDVQALGNRVSGATGDGFRVHGTGCLFVGNKAKGSFEHDLLDDSGGGNTYVDNDFGTTDFE